MSIAEKLTTIAENEQRVYDAGYNKASKDEWDKFTDSNNRRFYEYAFARSGYEYIRPPYKITSTSRTLYMFEYCTKLKAIESDYFDLSGTATHNTASNTSSLYYTFRLCTSLEVVEDIGIPANSYHYTFAGCSKLHTIEVMRCKKAATYTDPFNSCPELVNIKFVGEIGNNFTMADCSKLSYESLTAPEEEVNGEMRKGLMYALYDFVGNGETTTRTLTLHPTAKARLTEDDIKTITDKGWTLV